MTQQKDLKRRIRSRMQKTGESYTAARAVLLAKKEGARPDSADNAAAPAPSQSYATLAGTSDEAVAARTGRTWAQWVSTLDAVDAAAKPHRDIAAYVGATFDVGGWWAQAVTVGYERIKGLREIGQAHDGGYEANKSKTVPVPLARLYAAFADESLRRRWLPGVELTVRTATPERSLRITWEDGTSVEVYFVAKGDAKSQVALQHRKLTSRKDIEQRKAYWGERLKALAELLTSG